MLPCSKSFFQSEWKSANRGGFRLRRRPQFVRYSLQGDPPYLYQRRRRQLFRRKGSPSDVRSLEELRAQFKQLIADPDVRGVVVVIERLRASAAKREAVADLFRQMRSAGKLVVGYAVHLTNGEEELPDYLRSLRSTPNGSSPREPAVAPFTTYVRSKPFGGLSWKPIKRQPRVAWVPLHGLIVAGEMSGSPVGLGVAGSKTIGKALKAAAEDQRCQAIVLDVASPGGSALASELILDQVRRAAQKKAVVVYTDQVAASGGYLAALGAKEIWAAPHAIVGSIGVFAGKFDFSELLERLGIHRAILTRGQNAGIFSSSRPFTGPEREVLEAEVEETYQDFLEKVAKARGKTIEEAHQRGEGRIFSGAEAMQLGLVDRTGGFEGACRRALELAGAPTPTYQVVSYAPAARRLSLLAALREISSSQLFALWDWWLEIGGESWLGKMLLFLLLACLGGLGACATAERAQTRSTEIGAIQPDTSDQVLGQFLDAAEKGDFDSAYQLLAGSWRARYTPARLKQDFELEPRAKELVGRARSALKRGGREAGGVAEYSIGDGKAVRLVRENGVFKIASLE